jgi:hypothetical protein
MNSGAAPTPPGEGTPRTSDCTPQSTQDLRSAQKRSILLDNEILPHTIEQRLAFT